MCRAPETICVCSPDQGHCDIDAGTGKALGILIKRLFPLLFFMQCIPCYLTQLPDLISVHLLPNRQDGPKHGDCEWGRRGLCAVPAHPHQHPHPPGIIFDTTAKSWGLPEGVLHWSSGHWPSHAQDKLWATGRRGKSGLERQASQVTRTVILLLQ